MAPKQLVWLITGTSSGLGRELALGALERGDKVIATARGRSFDKLADLKEKGAAIIQLDVTAPLVKLAKVAEEAVNIYGRVDIIVNNAGYIETGSLEEITPEETFDQYNTNVLAPLNVNRAFLPYLRKQKSGYIVWAGSIAGWMTKNNLAFGLYSSTKYAVRGLAEALNNEISPLGLRSLCFEFGYFRTNLLSDGNKGNEKSRIEDYKPIFAESNAALASYDLKQPGDPKRGVNVILDVVRGEGVAAGRKIPTTISLGSDCYETTKEEIEAQLKKMEEWKDVTISTDFPKGT